MAQPNVLLICADHWPGRLIHAAGHPSILTPTLDQLCANGVRFSNAYSALPTCIPARRSLMTGTTARVHGDRIFDEDLPMPNLPTLAQTFRNAGYQAFAVGKMHVYPQRDRIGFDDVILHEEGRHHLGIKADDYEMFLAEQGYPGQELTHAMCNNEYTVRPWHLPEAMHPTNWSVREMCRAIRRRDPTRPGFWYLSFSAPHPPITPPKDYLDMYRDAEIPEPFIGKWAQDPDSLPYALKVRQSRWLGLSEFEMRLARQGFYAQCTYLDHQIRLVIGMLREEGLLNDTILLFTADHGDMLGNHRQFAKAIFYEDSAKIPMILVPTAKDERIGHHRVDDRLAELQDVMPTLLDLAGLPIPESVEGRSLAGDFRREFLYGEHYEGDTATRMVRDSRYKLIYYPVGNRFQLFDLEQDPDELHDLSDRPEHQEKRQQLEQWLLESIYGKDLEWVKDGSFVGLPDKPYRPAPNRGLTGQRGWRFVG